MPGELARDENEGTPEGRPPKACLIVDAPRLLSPAEAKRARFIQNLKLNYARLKEAMGFFEYFALICELSPERIEAIRKANQEALAELGRKFEEKLAEYDRLVQRE